MTDKRLGQVACEGYSNSVYGVKEALGWEKLPEVNRTAWQAAADAVVKAVQSKDAAYILEQQTRIAELEEALRPFVEDIFTHEEPCTCAHCKAYRHAKRVLGGV